jgi:hypothetical protein
MLDKGMLATVNSDDPAYFQSYITDNLKTAQQEGGLTKKEVARSDPQCLHDLLGARGCKATIYPSAGRIRRRQPMRLNSR